MKILIKNGLLIPMSDTVPALCDGPSGTPGTLTTPKKGDGNDNFFPADIAVLNSKIYAIEDKRKTCRGDFPWCIPEDFHPDRTIDAAGKIVIPGFVNAHTHLSMGLLRNYADDLDLFTWLNEKIWPAEARLTEKDIYLGSMLGAAEMIRSGTTAFADMYFMQESTCRAVSEAGIRANIGVTFFGDIADTEQRLPEYEKIITQWNGACGGRISIDVAPHAVYTCSRETLLAAIGLSSSSVFSGSNGGRIHIHISETSRENSDFKAKEGVTPAAYLESLGLFDRPVYAAHCVHMDKPDRDILKRNGVFPIHNPSSNLKLGSGFSPVPEFMQEGIVCGMGTDGASSNNNLNMMEEMHIASLVHKGYTGDPTMLSAIETLRMATIQGAKALGIDDRCGSIEPGKDADLLLINTDAPHMQPLFNPVSAMVYSAQAADIELVMCAGTILMENGLILTFNEESAVKKAAQAAKRLVNGN